MTLKEKAEHALELSKHATEGPWQAQLRNGVKLFEQAFDEIAKEELKMSDNKPREFWIHYTGCEYAEAFSSLEKFKDYHNYYDAHAIEYSAFEAQAKQLEDFRTRIEELEAALLYYATDAFSNRDYFLREIARKALESKGE